MRSQRPPTLLIASVLLLVGCNGSSNSNNTGTSNGGVPGGYSASPTNAKDSVSAAEFAVAEQSKQGTPLKLISIRSVKTQIVAGYNLEMIMIVSDGQRELTAQATVYTDLSQVRSLSNWIWM